MELFFEKLENHICKFHKNLNIVGDVFYMCVKFQFKRSYTLAYTKMTIFDKF
jgi:hypothetical protein